jgi:hypothetical protein
MNNLAPPEQLQDKAEVDKDNALKLDHQLM